MLTKQIDIDDPVDAGTNRLMQGGLGLMIWGAKHRILTDYVQPGRGCEWRALNI